MDSAKELVLMHFTDAYHIEQRDKEPVGGAPRFTGLVRKIQAEHPNNSLLLFSGDVYSPSLMGAVFRGKEMQAVLNVMKPDVGCLGNHDFDYSMEELDKFVKEAQFTWLLSNVIDTKTGKPAANATEKVILQRNGIKIGIMGIVEDEWLTTLAVDTSHFQYKDFSSEATRLAAELRADGADIIVVLSHMRQPNDQILAQTAKGIDIILGGHDHFYVNEVINGVPLVKSGTDFRWLSKVTASVVLGSSAPTFKIETIDITNEIPEEPTVKALVDKYQAEMSSKLCKVIGYSEVQLDARASTCRLKESNLGNFICDIMRHEYGADCTILNGGTIRSDDVYEGKFSIQSLLNILPFEDICVVVRVPGSAIRAALENGFSQLPKQEGRFPQLSGIRVVVDASKPAGSRVTSVSIGDAPLEDSKEYTLATKPYMLDHDGYNLAGHPYVVDTEHGNLLSNLVRNYFKKAKVIDAWKHAGAVSPAMRALSALKKDKVQPHFAPQTDGRITFSEQ